MRMKPIVRASVELRSRRGGIGTTRELIELQLKNAKAIRRTLVYYEGSSALGRILGRCVALGPVHHSESSRRPGRSPT
jgi:hypothetical protein